MLDVMKPLDQNSNLYIRVLRDFKRWAKVQTFIHTPGMVGQTEMHYPCKVAYAVSVYDHDKERFTSIKVMVPDDGRVEWRVIEL